MELLKSFPFFRDRKVLYVHGFASSGATHTATLLREMLPEAEVLAPDLPVHPAEALDMLAALCRDEQPALVIGTSMGGAYAETLHGFERILVNPAFEMGETLRTNVGLGKVTFQNPRRDGLTDFMLTKTLLEEYRDITTRCFARCDKTEQQRVFGLFGRQDTLVHTRPLFAKHYTQCVDFEGGHRMNDSILLHSVAPIVRLVSDRQERRERPVLYVSLSTLLHPDGTEVSEAGFAFERLAQRYDTYVVCPQDECPREWIDRRLGVAAWNRLVLTNHKQLLYGDYLIDNSTTGGSSDFLGTRLAFGTPEFKTWEHVLNYFDLLGGQ